MSSMPASKCFALVFSILICSRLSVSAASRYVATNSPSPGSPYTTWETAGHTLAEVVSAASAGDVVIVSNGVHTITSEIIVGTKQLVITNHAGDPALTILDGNHPATTNRCFYIQHADTILSGFTIRNGYARSSDRLGRGGGVHVNNGQVENCVFVSNTAVVSGSLRGGGGLAIYNGIVRGCVFSNNLVINSGSADTYSGGGGVLVHGESTGPAVIQDCVFVDNVASNYCSGGGIMILYKGHVYNSVFSNNASYAGSYGGGGLFLYVGGGIVVSNCVVWGNTLYGGNASGAGISAAANASTIIRNCLIANNSALGGGAYAGGILYGSYAKIENCTIVSNYARAYGGGCLCAGISNMINCIVYSNICGGKVASDNVHDSAGGANWTSLTYCCVAPGSGFKIENVVGDYPEFVAFGSDFRLGTDSPCINRGLRLEWMQDAVDLGGRMRLDRAHRLADIGCYEYVWPGTFFSIR